MLQTTLRLSALLLLAPASIITNAQTKNEIHFGLGSFVIPETASYLLGNSGFHAEVTSFFPLSTSFNSPKRHLGLDVKMGYSHFNKEHEAYRAYSEMKYTNSGPGPVGVTLDLITYGKSRGVHLLAGPSMVYIRRNFFFSPSLLAGISWVSREGGEFIDTIRHGSDPSQDKVISFQYIDGAKRFGFTVNPSLKAGWWLNTRFGVSLDAQYIIGPRLLLKDRTLSVGTELNAPGIYTYDEIVTGEKWKRDGSAKWEALVLQVNLSFRFLK